MRLKGFSVGRRWSDGKIRLVGLMCTILKSSVLVLFLRILSFTVYCLYFSNL